LSTPASDTAAAIKIPYLDGLRGYSILAVVCLHSTGELQLPNWLLPLRLMFANGALGVNIFFTISGFLITTLLLREWDLSGTISIPAFYQRRIARIFPAAYLYIAVIAVLAMAGIVQLTGYTFAAAILSSWNYGSLLGFFVGSTDDQVLNHFWSLTLEEQFYLFWPACLFLIGRPRSRKVAWICVAVFPLIRFASYFAFPGSRPQLTQMFHTGIDQIFWGTLVAFAYNADPRFRWGKTIAWGGQPLLGWLTLCYALFTIFLVGGANFYIPAVGRFISPTVYSSFAALLLIWLLSGDTGVIRAILSWKPLCWVGVLSYSLYVWQQLFLAPKSPLRPPFPLSLVCAFLAAILSYYFVEAPLRAKIRGFFRRRNRRGCAILIR
jgi:peptidoglycan/LPS O-acetylase OafA/YrhL